MPTATPLYGTNTLLTHTLNSLANDTTGLVGRQSSRVDNTAAGTANWLDFLIGGKFTLSASAVTAGQIEVWAFGSYDNGTSHSGTAGATDAALTLTAGRKYCLMPVIVIPTATTVSEVFIWGPIPLSAIFLGIIPTHWGLWVTQKTGQALAASGNEIRYTPTNYESA